MKFTFPPESRPLDGYTLKRGIARGGFGEVYYGLSDAGKEVAVKLLQQNMEVELRGVQHCLNLRHPHLVAIYDVKTDADQDHWVIMEYIAGDTLEQVLLKQRGPLPLDQIERWMRGVESGLAYLHDRGIVHRDVKPGNIFWDEGAIKIGDVGLSKFMTPSRRSAHTESVGTVYYMAPEVTYGKYGYEVDIYSCGVMLYEMLTGKLPFDGQSTGEILMKHLSENPDLSIVPPQFQRVLESALRKDPKARTPTITQMFKEFEDALHGRQAQFAQPLPRTGQPTQFADPVPQSVLPVIPVAAIVQPRPIQPVGGTAFATPFPFARTVPEIPVAQSIPHSPPPNASAASRNQVLEDTPSLDWWLLRIATFISLAWVSYGVFNRHSASAIVSLVTVWPILLMCLRFEPTRGSGLTWLWRGIPPGTSDAPYAATWWARRLAVVGFASLTLFGLLNGPFEFEDASIPLTMLASGFLAAHFLRPSIFERNGISLRSGNMPTSKSWAWSDRVDRLAFQIQQWDQTRFGFWAQRIGFYCWAQFMLICVSAGMERRSFATSDCIVAAVMLFPLMILGWMFIRPEMRPQFLQGWFRGRNDNTVRSGLLEKVICPNSRWFSGKNKVTADPVASPQVKTVNAANPRPVNSYAQTVVPPNPPPKSKPRTSGLALTPESVRPLSGRHRLADLTVSMTWAMVLTVLFAVGTGFLSPLFGVPSSLHPDPAKLGMFTITTLIGAWAILVTGKMCEGRSASGRSRRVLNLLVGLSVGAVAWWLGQVLMVELSSEQLRHQAAFVSLGRQPLLIDNRPTFLSFLVFFGLLFFLRRWWWHVDAFRPVIFRISSVVVTVAVAAVLPTVFAFPWDWAVTWAAVISCVVQLSAVWTPPERRIS